MTTSIKLGVAFDLNGQAIVLHPKETIEQIKENGIDLELPVERCPVKLGRVGSDINKILSKLGCSEKLEDIEGKLPDFPPLKDAYEKVITANLNVEKFHVKIPGKIHDTAAAQAKNQENAKADKTYTVGLSLTWDIDANAKETGLTLTGIYFEISNESAPVVPAEKTVEGEAAEKTVEGEA